MLLYDSAESDSSVAFDEVHFSLRCSERHCPGNIESADHVAHAALVLTPVEVRTKDLTSTIRRVEGNAVHADEAYSTSHVTLVAHAT
jgi:hypothetical protein